MSKSLIRFHTCLASIRNCHSQFSGITKTHDWFSAVTLFLVSIRTTVFVDILQELKTNLIKSASQDMENEAT